jgi:hypothetical protein
LGLHAELTLLSLVEEDVVDAVLAHVTSSASLVSTVDHMVVHLIPKS